VLIDQSQDPEPGHDTARINEEACLNQSRCKPRHWEAGPRILRPRESCAGNCCRTRGRNHSPALFWGQGYEHWQCVTLDAPFFSGIDAQNHIPRYLRLKCVLS
jgi:hypothetical protein